MPQYLVSYLDEQRRPAQAQVSAVDAHAVAAALRVAPAALLSVQPVVDPVSGPRSVFPLRQFSQQMAILLRAGIPLLEALLTLRQKEHQSDMGRVLSAMILRIQLGESFSAALRSQPQAFPPLFAAVVEASERSGQLAQALADHADYLAWVDTLRSRLIAAAVYPAMLIVAGMAVLLFLLLFVVPRFAGLLDGVGGELPLASRMLMSVGQFAGAYPMLILTVAVAALLLPVLAWQHGLRDWMQARLWRLPLIGAKLHVLALAQFYRSLSMLLTAGVSMVPALEASHQVMAARLRPALLRVTTAVREGGRLSASLETQGLATPVSLSMLRVGEQSGDVGKMLAEAAAFYDEELAQLSDLVSRLINPALMLLMGLIIGSVVVLMYLPIFQLVEQVQ